MYIHVCQQGGSKHADDKVIYGTERASMSMYENIHVYTYVCKSVCMSICMHARMYVHMHKLMYVCIDVYQEGGGERA